MYGNFIKCKQYHIEPYGFGLSEFKYNFALKFYSLLEDILKYQKRCSK